MKICYRNQQLLKDEAGFALFLTGHYKKSNARNKDLYLLYQIKDNRLINKIKIIKRECLFF